MVLITPKRLFDINTMETVMYEDVVDDVRENGYVAVSHVWGDQKKYVPKDVGIMGGVTWTIPLSDPGKISKVKDAMLTYKKKYCWFDVLCMPQDKQNEINEEIPFMGDYYAGADVVMVLATIDPVLSWDFMKWYDMMDDIMKTKRSLTDEELDWIESYNTDLLDISRERWFTRLWTFQEAVMAKELLLICGNNLHINLFEIAIKLGVMDKLGANVGNLFSESGFVLAKIFNTVRCRVYANLDLVDVMAKCSERDSFKDQDKFYGAFGALGYKDFPVSYEIKMDDLNAAIVRYAYSKEDITWLSVGGNFGAGFIQPMYKPFQYVGYAWKEDFPGICGIRLDDEIMHINAWPFAKVVCRGEPISLEEGESIYLGDIYQCFAHWEIGIEQIAKCMTSFMDVTIDMEVIEIVLEAYVGNQGPLITLRDEPDGREKQLSVVEHLAIQEDSGDIIPVKATTWEGKDIALKIVGDAEIGDQIMLVRATDNMHRSLGIVVDKYFRRKGVCLYEKIEMTEEEALSRYTPQEFPL